MERRCPPGSYCPSPREKVTCAAGTFCVAGSQEPFTCDFGGLILQNALAEVPQQQQTVIEQLYENGGPMAGNFCPEQSVSPTGMCVTAQPAATPAPRFAAMARPLLCQRWCLLAM